IEPHAARHTAETLGLAQRCVCLLSSRKIEGCEILELVSQPIPCLLKTQSRTGRLGHRASQKLGRKHEVEMEALVTGIDDGQSSDVGMAVPQKGHELADHASEFGSRRA